MPAKKKLTQLKTSVFSRSLSLAKLGLSAGLKYAGNRLTDSPFDEFLNSQIVLITKEFGELKGSVMKAGQMLSMYGEHFLPPEANKVLKSLQSDSPPISFEVMLRHLKNYLSDDLRNELEINPEPIGSASMGQVYQAVIKATGQKIALKIQYPEIEKAIDSDVAALKKILSFSKVLPKNIDLSGVFEEIKAMLRQELDYTHEAALTMKYRELLSEDDRYIVPNVHLRYSNEKVLATDFIEGLRADHLLIQGLSSERRNQLAENFIDLYFREIFDWGFVQTDPHLGNYKIKIQSNGQDQLVLLDFGAARTFTGAFLDNYRRLVKGAVVGDKELFYKGARGLGFIIESDSAEYIEQFEKFCMETVEPFRSSGTFNWKANDLPNRVVKSALRFKNFDLRSPPRDIIFLDRKTGGVFMFLSVLAADINAREIINPYLNRLKDK